MRFLRFLSVLFLCSFLIGLTCFPCFVWGQQNGYSSGISEAQGMLVNCFNAARAAEAAGANISALTNTLNVAGALLSNAQYAYSVGNFSGAQSLAAECTSKLSGFVGEANSLQVSATQNRNTSFLVNVVGSIVATMIVLVGSAVVWLSLKRKYGKSEVNKIESAKV